MEYYATIKTGEASMQQLGWISKASFWAKTVYPVWFHLHDLENQVKPIYSDKSENSGYPRIGKLYWLEDRKEVLGVIEMFHILIWMVVTLGYAYMSWPIQVAVTKYQKLGSL